MDFDIYDLIGSIGVATIIITYILLQAEKLKSESIWYSSLNAAGAGLIVFSLVFDFNFSAFIVELFWVLISLYGVFKSLRSK